MPPNAADWRVVFLVSCVKKLNKFGVSWAFLELGCGSGVILGLGGLNVVG